MQDSLKGKFCEKCSKCVIDFTDKTDLEINDIIKRTEDKEICGRILVGSFSKVAAGIILVTNLTFIPAQTINSLQSATEQNISTVIRLSGKLIFKRNKSEIANAEVFFISKKKYFKTNTDEKGNFILEILNEFIGRKNVLHFNFDNLNIKNRENPNRNISIVMNDDIYENTSIIFKKSEKINAQEFKIDFQHSYLGGVSIVTERPPDYYYFNGKSISERKFEKLKKENSKYQFFFFDGKEAEVIAKKSYLNSLQLLFSN